MPELPDVAVYIESLKEKLVGQTLTGLRLLSPFILRSVDVPLAEVKGRAVQDVFRMGKRIVIELEEERFVVIHLMISGRFVWKNEVNAKPAGRISHCAFDFTSGTLVFTEASSKKRASLHLVRGRENLVPFERGGLEVMASSLADFEQVLRSENHTLKRSLTDPRLFSGIGNAYSDEILHAARLSPVKLSTRLSAEEVKRLHAATLAILNLWTERLHAEAKRTGFPEKVTAFRPEMAVHGKYGQACPVCGSKVQRISYAENETNYCAECQNEGRLLADRGLSRLLKEDWPRSLDEMDERREQARAKMDAAVPLEDAAERSASEPGEGPTGRAGPANATDPAVRSEEGRASKTRAPSRSAKKAMGSNAVEALDASALTPRKRKSKRTPTAR